jgi:hypothetical protein
VAPVCAGQVIRKDRKLSDPQPFGTRTWIDPQGAQRLFPDAIAQCVAQCLAPLGEGLLDDCIQ